MNKIFIIFLSLLFLSNLVFGASAPTDDDWKNNFADTCSNYPADCIKKDPVKAMNENPLGCYDADPQEAMKQIKANPSLLTKNRDLMDKAFANSEQRGDLLNIINDPSSGVLDETTLGKVEAYFKEDISVLNSYSNIRTEYFAKTFAIDAKDATFRSCNDLGCETEGPSSTKISLDDLKKLDGAIILSDGSIRDKLGRDFRNVNIIFDGQNMILSAKDNSAYFQSQEGKYPDIITKKYYSNGGFYFDNKFYSSLSDDIIIENYDNYKLTIRGREVEVFDVNVQRKLYEFSGEASFDLRTKTFVFKEIEGIDSYANIYVGASGDNFVKVDIEKGSFIFDEVNGCKGKNSYDNSCASFNYNLNKEYDKIKIELSDKNRAFYEQNYETMLNNLIIQKKNELGVESLNPSQIKSLEEIAGLKIIQLDLDDRLKEVKKDYEDVDQSYQDDLRYVYLQLFQQTLDSSVMKNPDSSRREQLINLFKSSTLTLNALDTEGKFKNDDDIDKLGNTAIATGLSYYTSLDIVDFIFPPPTGLDSILTYAAKKYYENGVRDENFEKLINFVKDNPDWKSMSSSEQIRSLEEQGGLKDGGSILSQLGEVVGVEVSSKETSSELKRMLIHLTTISAEYQKATPGQRKTMLEEKYRQIGVI